MRKRGKGAASATAEGITVKTTTAADGSLSLSVSGASRPLEVHLMHQKLALKKDAKNPADSFAWNDAAMATVISWKAFNAPAELSLTESK